ncbi:hypothetical protein F4861DRAFT_539229 [Xylaria intraflava]|nr:hypothetical protein F4861DRAFT_539229 [Xylaria intraflava]
MTQPDQAPSSELRRRKTRSACDRCHRQKLRCVKTKGRPGCKRCADLDAECRYSPRDRKGRGTSRAAVPAPAILAPATQQDTALDIPELAGHDWFGAGTGLFDAQCDLDGASPFWPGYIAGTTDPAPGEEVTVHLPFSEDGHMAREAADPYAPVFPSIHEQTNPAEEATHPPETPFTFASTAARLNCLNMALNDCASRLSFGKPRAPDPGTRQAAMIALDEIFRATNDFISVTRALPRRGAPVSASASASASSLRRIDTPADEGPDDATLFLLLSCHCRLVEVYESIITAVRKCAGGSPPPLPASGSLVLPRLHVGGCALPARRVDFRGPGLPRATAAMYMVLVVTVMSELWAQVAGALREGIGLGGGVRVGMADSAWDVALRRTDRVSRTIETVQHLL